LPKQIVEAANSCNDWRTATKICLLNIGPEASKNKNGFSTSPDVRKYPFVPLFGIKDIARQQEFLMLKLTCLSLQKKHKILLNRMIFANTTLTY